MNEKSSSTERDWSRFDAHVITPEEYVHGVRKVRWSRSGMGKRGGMRILCYVQDAQGRIWLLTVYAKSARENIAASTLNALREIVDHANII